MGAAVEAENLVKKYGAVTALAGLSLSVPEGTVLGLLGPNGAGKTTCVRILSTLLRPDAGSIRVAGLDVLAEPNKVREIIGLSGQTAAVDEYLTGYENLEMIGRLYRLGKRTAKQRSYELLERFDLTEAANRPVKTYSGGMRRRLDLAAALLVSPPVIFMDEPTTGLDPRSRQGMWEVIGERVRSGATLLLTTQYLEEADQLADDIVVIDHGKAIAHGSPADLKRDVGGERLLLTVAPDDAAAARAILARVGHDEPVYEPGIHQLSVGIASGPTALMSAVRLLDEAGVTPADITVHHASLDDVFMALTGAHLTEDEEATQ
jgi:ABC-2 type transport system ATP-binding protein